VSGAYFAALCKCVTLTAVLVHAIVYAQHGRAISYGKSRSIAIFNALDEVLGDNHDWWTLRGPAAMAAKQDFIATVAVHLRRAGIDPMQVHI